MPVLTMKNPIKAIAIALGFEWPISYKEIDERLDRARKSAFTDGQTEGYTRGFEAGKTRPRYSNGRFKKMRKFASSDNQLVMQDA